MSDVDKRIGEAVLTERGRMTQQAFADAMRERGHKWSQATVWSVEKGERPLRLSEAASVAEVLGVEIEHLIDPSPTAAQDKRAMLLAHVVSTGGFRDAVRGIARQKGNRAELEKLLEGGLSDEARQRSEDALREFTVERAVELGTVPPEAHIEWMVEVGLLKGEEALQWLERLKNWSSNNG